MHANIDANSQRLIDECPGYGVKAISILQAQCANMKISDQSRYNRMIQKVLHKGGKSAINYIEIFQNAKDLEFSVGNSYTEDRLIHNFLDNFH